MSEQQQKTVPQYGVSQPICTKMPSDRELRLTQDVCLNFNNKI